MPHSLCYISETA